MDMKMTTKRRHTMGPEAGERNEFNIKLTAAEKKRLQAKVAADMEAMKNESPEESAAKAEAIFAKFDY